MSIRDEELKRLILYARGLNIQINIKNYACNDAGTWTYDPVAKIDINKRTHTTKTDLILTLLHELAHHINYSYTKQTIPDGYENGTKRERKRVYDYEWAGIKYMENLVVELQLKIPMWKVKKAMAFDAWQYEVYYLTGNYPTKLEKKIKNKELNLKYKGLKT